MWLGVKLVAQPYAAKSDWMVAKGMLQKQLIAYYPVTGRERKIDSYTVIEGPRGSHWRDDLGIPYVAPRACKPLPGDFDEDCQARKMQQFVDPVLPSGLRSKFREVKMPTTLSMVKHVQSGGVEMIKPPDVGKLLQQLKGLEVQRSEGDDNEIKDVLLQPAAEPQVTVIKDDAKPQGDTPGQAFESHM